MSTYEMTQQQQQQQQQSDPARDREMNELRNMILQLQQEMRSSVVTVDTDKDKQLSLRPETPSLFHGQSNENIDSWLYELELYFDAMKVSQDNDQTRILFTKAQLRGAASAWFQHLDTIQDDSAQTQALTWNQFKQLLTDRFRPVAVSKLARMQLNTLRQTGSVEQFIQQYMQVISAIPSMTEEERVDRFITGLKPHIRNSIHMFDPNTLQSAMSMAQRADIQGSHYSNNRYNGQSSFNPSQRNNNRNVNRVNNSSTYYPIYSQPTYNVNSNPFSTQAAPRFQNSNFVPQHNSSDLFRSNSDNYSPNSNYNGNRYDNNTSVPMQIDRMASSRVCFACKHPGHLARNCPTLKHRLQLMSNSDNQLSQHSTVVEVTSPEDIKATDSNDVTTSRPDHYRLNWQPG
jgi:hypothetical protein